MMVFWRAKLAFLATPKTGTQAYQAALRNDADVVIKSPPSAKHMNFRRYDRHMRGILGKENSADLETIAVIRDPLDWLGSWYRYRARDQIKGHPNSTADMSFDQFVRGYLSQEQPAFARVGAQFNFVRDQNGKVGVNRLFDFANLDPLNAFFEHRLGKAVDPARKNVSGAFDLSLDEATLAALREQCIKDFELYELVSSSASGCLISD